MRNNFVLIDFESVQSESLAPLDHDDFKVMVFIGSNQAKLSVDLAMALQRMGSKAEYVRISGNGPNALDFHIAFYIGLLVAHDPTAYFHIISRDTGFDPLIQHLKSRKTFASRWRDVSEIPLVKAGATVSPEDRAGRIIERLQRPKATRPRTVKTLSNAIASAFQKQITDQEVAAIISSLQQRRFIAIEDGRVQYSGG